MKEGWHRVLFWILASALLLFLFFAGTQARGAHLESLLQAIGTTAAVVYGVGGIWTSAIFPSDLLRCGPEGIPGSVASMSKADQDRLIAFADGHLTSHRICATTVILVIVLLACRHVARALGPSDLIKDLGNGLTMALCGAAIALLIWALLQISSVGDTLERLLHTVIGKHRAANPPKCGPGGSA